MSSMRRRFGRARVFYFLAAVVVVVAAAPGAALAGGASAADAQYTSVPPITKPAAAQPPPPPVVAEGNTAGQPGGSLPFTGLSLLAPVGLSIVLVVGGIALRRKLSADPRQ